MTVTCRLTMSCGLKCGRYIDTQSLPHRNWWRFSTSANFNRRVECHLHLESILYALIGINTNNDTALSTAPVPLEIPIRPGHTCDNTTCCVCFVGVVEQMWAFTCGWRTHTNNINMGVCVRKGFVLEGNFSNWGAFHIPTYMYNDIFGGTWSSGQLAGNSLFSHLFDIDVKLYPF